LEKDRGPFKEFTHHLVGRGALADQVQCGMILAKLKDQFAFTDAATPVDWPEGAVWPLISVLERRQFLFASNEREIVVSRAHAPQHIHRVWTRQVTTR
jgi:hypothetical protein